MQKERENKDLQDACVLSVGVAFAMIVVRVDLVGDGDLQFVFMFRAMFSFVCFIRGRMWFAARRIKSSCARGCGNDSDSPVDSS